MRNVRVRVAAALIGGAIAGAWPNAARQTGQDPQRPVFTATTHVVEVDVTVVDRSGRPVLDLTAADFDLREDGEPQQIQAIYLATLDAGVSRSPRAPEGPEATTLPVRRPLSSRMFVFVLDTAHLSADGLTRSRRALEKFLPDGLTPADIAGLVVNGQMVGNRLDTDRTRLRAALGAPGPPAPARPNEMRAFPRILDDLEAAMIARDDIKTIERVVERACLERPAECRGPGESEVVRIEVENKGRRLAVEAARSAQATLTSIQTLSASLGRFPGPKYVVVFSEGFYVDEFTSWLQEVVGLAARNGVRFTVIDARGLGRDPRTPDPFAEQPVTSAGDLTPTGIDVNTDVLTSLALDTGGQLVRNRNDVAPALEQLARETAAYYVLGYTPKKAADGSFRRISVRVARPDVVIRARRGYLANVDAATAPKPAVPERGSGLAPAAPVVPPPATPPDAARPAVASAPSVRPGSTDRIANLLAAAPPPSRSSAEAARLANEGWAFYREGKVEAAQAKFAAAVATGDSSVWVHYALGQAEFALQKYEPAIREWEIVRQHAADYQPVYFDLADAYLQLDRTTDSIAVLREAERRWSGDSEVHNALGVILARRGSLDDAIASFQRAVAAAPDEALGYFNLGRTYQLRYLQRLRTSSRAEPGGGQPSNDRDRQRAIDAFTKYLQIGGPFEAQARDAMAMLQWRELAGTVAGGSGVPRFRSSGVRPWFRGSLAVPR